MEEKPDGKPRNKIFLDIPNAAELAGISVRHFRRIIEEETIPTLKINGKIFLLVKDFERWEQVKKPHYKGQ